MRNEPVLYGVMSGISRNIGEFRNIPRKVAANPYRSPVFVEYSFRGMQFPWNVYIKILNGLLVLIW